MKLVLILSGALSIAMPAFAEDAVGKWKGDLIGGDGPVPVSVVITKGADGKLAGVGTAPSGSVDLTDVASDGSVFSFGAGTAGNYKATWDAVKKAWTGKLN